MKLILVRHGLTEANIKRVIQSHTHGVLSEEGRRQVKRVAERLKEEHIDVIYSSDLARALDTAKEIAKFHTDVPLHTTTLLRERDFASLEGGTWGSIDWDNLPSDVEKEDVLFSRVRELLSTVYAKHPDGTVLFVGHAGINVIITAQIIGKTTKELWESCTPKNTAVSVFTFKGFGNTEAHKLNCVSHLES